MNQISHRTARFNH